MNALQIPPAQAFSTCEQNQVVVSPDSQIFPAIGESLQYCQAKAVICNPGSRNRTPPNPHGVIGLGRKNCVGMGIDQNGMIRLFAGKNSDSIAGIING